jgi:RNA polymerase sigma factor (sigma-70 family)
MSSILKAFVENEAAIKRFLRRFTSDSSYVDDFAQETFLKSFAAETRTNISEPKAFLFKVARNIVLSDVRHEKTSASGNVEEVDDMNQVLDEKQSTPESWLDGRQKLLIFSKAVAQLSPQCRKALLLRRVDGLEYKQIADRLGITVSTVEKHVTRGLLRCGRYLREQGYEPSEFGSAIKEAKKAKVGSLSRKGGGDE